MNQLPWLSPTHIAFPDPNEALDYPAGLLAAGGALTPDWLTTAYSQGIFPWYNHGETILWWSPATREIIYTDQIHISKSLQKTLIKNLYSISIDRAFEQVIRACAEPRGDDNEQNSTWISEDMVHAYCTLHQQGFAHSIEVWDQQELVGGLYGVALGRMFFGESMFSRKRDCSKIALFHLAQRLKEWQYVAIDCQIYSDHLASMGAVEVSRDTFETLLKHYVHRTTCHWQYNKSHEPS